ncbi:MAG TPA: hypothetical protein VIT45_16850 [Allosphingosinicella sp.]
MQSFSTIIETAIGTKPTALDENLNAATSLRFAKLYARYRASIATCRENPPGEGWDGVTVTETK